MNSQDQTGVTREQLSLGALLIVTAIALYVCWRVVAPFLPALTWALALAIVAYPIYDKVAARVSKPDLASGLAVCLVTLIIIAPIVLVTQQVVSQFTSQQSGGWEQWKSKILEHPKLAPIVERIEQNVNIEQELKSAAESVQKRLSSFARSAVQISIQLAICLFTLFYFFRDRKRILTAARSYLPLSAPEFDDLTERIGTMIHATIYGTFVVACIQGALGGVMFWVLGLPAPLLWSVAMTIAAIIPVLGAFVVWAPATLYLLAQGEIWKAIVLALFGTIIISLADNLLYPILVGKELRMHTLLVFLAILGGIAVFGMSGIVLGPAALAVTLGLLDILRQRTVAGRPAEQPR
jgi:predicted PurR-regulated permease PerM